MKVILPKSYYSQLTPTDLVFEVLEYFPESEQEEARELLIRLMDTTALRAILTSLDNKQDKLAFLEIYRDQYDQNHLLDWVVLKTDNIYIQIKEALERALLALHQKIKN